MICTRNNEIKERRGQKGRICTRDWQPSPRLIGKSRGIAYICGGNYFQAPADNMDGMLRQVADRSTDRQAGGRQTDGLID